MELWICWLQVFDCYQVSFLISVFFVKIFFKWALYFKECIFHKKIEDTNYFYFRNMEFKFKHFMLTSYRLQLLSTLKNVTLAEISKGTFRKHYFSHMLHINSKQKLLHSIERCIKYLSLLIFVSRILCLFKILIKKLLWCFIRRRYESVNVTCMCLYVIKCHSLFPVVFCKISSWRFFSF